jgi:hypothetical protein
LVAIGTIALAVATYQLARSTQRMAAAAQEELRSSKEMAEATRAMAVATQQSVEASNELARAAREQVQLGERQADLSREALDGTIQPILVDVPRDNESIEEYVEFAGSDEKTLIRTRYAVIVEDRGAVVRVSVPFRNIGRGVAFVGGGTIVGGKLRLAGAETERAMWCAERTTKAVLPPGELTRISASVPTDRPELQELVERIRMGGFDVEVVYRNVYGGNETKTRAIIYRDSTKRGEHRVRQIFLHKDHEPDFFAASGPSD